MSPRNAPPQSAPDASPSAVAEVEADAERRALEARVARLEAALSREAKERADLVHLVTHELRTPITILSGFLKLLEKEEHGALAPEPRRFVGEALKACLRLDATVEDLLEARHDPAAAFPVRCVAADLRETIESPLAALTARFETRGTKVEASWAADPAPVDHDPRRLEQVVSNLLVNALRHGRPSGLVRVGTQDVVLAGDVPGVEVRIDDDGPGIPEADRERLFAPFVRGGVAAERGGLGIGLALCRRIVEAHGGHIRIEASVLGGACFVFAWPRAVRETNQESEEGRHG